MTLRDKISIILAKELLIPIQERSFAGKLDKADAEDITEKTLDSILSAVADEVEKIFSQAMAVDMEDHAETRRTFQENTYRRILTNDEERIVNIVLELLGRKKKV